MRCVIGWSPDAPSYAVDWHSFRTGLTTNLATGLQTNRYEYEVDDSVPDGESGLLLVIPEYETLPNGTRRRGKPLTFPINNPPSRAELRWRIRRGLGDVVESPDVDMHYYASTKWSDDEVNALIAQSIGFLNKYVHKTVEWEATFEVARTSWANVMDTIVEVSLWNRSRWVDIVPAQRRQSAIYRRPSWSVIAGRLDFSFYVAPETPVRIAGYSDFRVPRSDRDVFDVPQTYWDILDLHVRGSCLLRIAGETAQADRWREGMFRVENPPLVVARELLAEAESRARAAKSPKHQKRTAI
jgi:hypothetical protein